MFRCRIRIRGSSPRVRGTGWPCRGRPALRRFIPACAGNGLHRPLWRSTSPVHPRVCGERAVYGVGRSPTTVHPRVCGERRATAMSSAGSSGSSPRVRGTGQPLHLHVGHRRFIPACAGNGHGPARSGRPGTVHPRVCGERDRSSDSKLNDYGSSPRVRGTDHRDHAEVGLHRFIPACAGNGSSRSAPTSGTTVHPRVCGERGWNGGDSGRYDGSSPRVRGTGPAGGSDDRAVRFIPACAGNGLRGGRRHRRRAVHPACVGNGWTVRTWPRSRPVHPRVCGERLYNGDRSHYIRGSSPRVRGTGRPQRFRAPAGRFIPACAGNGSTPENRVACLSVHPRVCGERPDRAPGSGRRAVHPRVCGERYSREVLHATAFGSSPRVRGTDVRIDHERPGDRFIPACAGNGLERRRNHDPGAVHPRVCGERALAELPNHDHIGSSPRVRGTAVPDGRPRRVGRFIPACAGNGPGDSGITRGSAGSSPRVRGTDDESPVALGRSRFIPACAGNGASLWPGPRSSAVHPRVCGERELPAVDVLRVHRFIPACAGNGWFTGSIQTMRSVHPRVCGERGRRVRPSAGGSGSSPRVRGTAVRSCRA